MPCVYYVPTKSVVADHGLDFVNETEVQLCFRLSTAPTLDHNAEKNVEFSMSGRPCITGGLGESLRMSMTSSPMKVREKPKWVEFMRSTSCGESVRIDPKSLPIDCFGVQNGIIDGTFTLTMINKFYFTVAFTMMFWDFDGDT